MNGKKETTRLIRQTALGRVKATQDVIGRYRRAEVGGLTPTEIVFVKLTHEDGFSEWVTWDRSDGVSYRGIYRDTFVAALHDFVERIKKDSPEEI